jgi:hypothetical protein
VLDGSKNKKRHENDYNLQNVTQENYITMYPPIYIVASVSNFQDRFQRDRQEDGV